MRVRATLHGFAEKERELDLPANATADDAPRALGIRPELVLVFRGERPLPSDEPLAEGDSIRILRVVSGGNGGSWKFPSRVGLAFLLLLLLSPTALADHVYSHRIVMDGRLMGSDGLPLPGRTIEFFSDGADFLEPCREGPHQSVTDQWGEFRFCFHQHSVPVGTKIGVRSGNVSVIRPVDVTLRRTSVVLREPNETGIEPDGWNTTYRITGRAWRPGPTSLEGVTVFGLAVIGLPVNLTIRPAADGNASVDGEPLAVFSTRTDGYGDFDLIVETPANASALSLMLEAEGHKQPTQLDAFSRRTFAPVYTMAIERADPPSAQDADDRPSGPTQPGSTTPRLNPVLVVAVLLALVAAIVLSRRK